MERLAKMKLFSVINCTNQLVLCQNVVMFRNQLHQSIGIMSLSKNKYYDELKQVDITQAPAEPSENLTFLFHSWKNWKSTPHLETAFH
jgi:hypothetical protein